jgi:membrane-bound serine protease (ClpP class)
MTVLALGAAMVVLTLVPSGTAGGQLADPGRSVALTRVVGPITPVTDEHLAAAIATAAEEGSTALIVVLDTPGGLVSSTRRIVQEFLGAPLPVVVHVAPPGADAGSAGTFITYAAHVAAMAPATTIGAATPVDLEGGEVGDKVVENATAFARALAEERGRDVGFAVAAVREGASITAAEALERGVVDLIATDTADLLRRIDGLEVVVRDAAWTIETAGATVREIEMSPARRLLSLIADPNVAFLLLSLGTLAILYEIANPGLGLGGVVGVVSLVLALYALSVLPVNQAGAALILVAGVMFLAELFAPGIGVGAAGGTAALLLGGLFLFRAGSGVDIALGVLLPTAAVTAGLAVLLGMLVARTRAALPPPGATDLAGRTVTVEGAADGHPRAQVAGSSWRLVGADGAPLTDGQRMRVLRRDNLDLVVVPTDEAADEAADDTTDDPRRPDPSPRSDASWSP